MTPAERLLAAADLLDKRAGEATPGPWVLWGGSEKSLVCTTVDGCTCGGGLEGYGHEPGCGLEEPPGVQATNEDAAYIATMHPEVGKEQAAWLRESATDLIDTPGTWTQHTLCARFIGHPDETNRCRHYDPALRLADLILAGAS